MIEIKCFPTSSSIGSSNVAMLLLVGIAVVEAAEVKSEATNGMETVPRTLAEAPMLSVESNNIDDAVGRSPLMGSKLTFVILVALLLFMLSSSPRYGMEWKGIRLLLAIFRSFVWMLLHYIARPIYRDSSRSLRNENWNCRTLTFFNYYNASELSYYLASLGRGCQSDWTEQN